MGKYKNIIYLTLLASFAVIGFLPVIIFFYKGWLQMLMDAFNWAPLPR